jgi:hypothetical protein
VAPLTNWRSALVRRPFCVGQLDQLGSKLWASQPDLNFHTKAVQDAHFALIQATAKGSIAVALAKDLSALFETQRRVIETTSLEERISRLEQRGPK